MNNLIPIPLQQDTVGEDLSSTESNFGTCTQCGHSLEEAEYAIGDVCDSCRPAFLERRQDEQDAAAEARAEARRYPEESDECDCLGYGCHECGGDQ